MIISTIAILLSLLIPNPKTLNPVEWNFESKKIAENEYELYFHANIQDDWVVYTTDTPEGGPVPTSFFIDDNDSTILDGEITTNSKIYEKEDPLFEIIVRKHKKEAIYIQKIKTIGTFPITITGELEYMTCDGKRCLPPTSVPFSFTLN